MKLLKSILPVAFILGAGCFTATAQEAEKHPEKPLLWKVEGKELKKPSYLFGTIHLSTPPVGNLHPAAEKAFEASDVVYTEIPMDMKTQMGMVGLLMRKDGKTLDESIGEKLSGELDAELKAINPQLNAVPFQTFKTWAMAASIPLLKSQLKGEQALDLALWNRATKEGKETGGLETAEGQVGVFEAFGEADQVKFLGETLKQLREDRESGKDSVGALVSAYASGDEEKVRQEMDKAMEQMAAGENKDLGERLMKRLLTDRDASMAKTIGEKLQAAPDKTQFFAVGAGHYAGKPGIRGHLEEQGYRVTAIKE